MPPGPIDNKDIERKLIEEQEYYLDSEAFKKNQDFYNVSKPLFYFFQSLYGGGPVIINNSVYKD